MRRNGTTGFSLLFLVIIMLIVSFTRVAVKHRGAYAKENRRVVATLNRSDKAPADTHPLMAAPLKGMPEKVLVREGYTCSYNVSTREPNYVAWVLTPTKAQGSFKRGSTFFEDPELTDDEKATLDDYRSSGFDRGHMCPAGDNKWSKTAMIESFYLSNICPQTHSLNGGDWKELEEACRDWVLSQHETIYIVCGPVFVGSEHRRLHRRVTVPEQFFKALLCLDKGKEKGIAFLYNNNKDNRPMSSYVKSIDEVEALTGYNLFYKVNLQSQSRLEKEKDLEQWAN